MNSERIEFKSNLGHALSARLERPIDKEAHTYAIFAHVFTGSKNLPATRCISRALTQSGIAVLRFDFTGLGDSEGDFADTNFSSNVEDLLAASEYLQAHYKAPSIIIGHSLGGAASIFAASKLESIKAVATIGTPSQPDHVSHLFKSSIEEIESQGLANVNIGGRAFTIKKHFLDDLKSKDMFNILKDMDKAILVLHSPQDNIVGIENAAEIYQHAKHPKSFVTLNGADHMLSRKDDAHYVGELVASWAKRYIDIPKKEALKTDKQVVARLGEIGYTTEMKAGQHSLIADEDEAHGGDDFGPSPYEYLSAGLGACTAITIQMYARRKNWPLEEVKVHLSYGRDYQKDCEECEDDTKRIEAFERHIELKGDLSQEQVDRIMIIADKCPVHKTLSKEVQIKTELRVNA